MMELKTRSIRKLLKTNPIELEIILGMYCETPVRPRTYYIEKYKEYAFQKNFQSALDKIFADEDATKQLFACAKQNTSAYQVARLNTAYQKWTQNHADLSDPESPAVQELLSKFEGDEIVIAKYRFGIGTGYFCPKNTFAIQRDVHLSSKRFFEVESKILRTIFESAYSTAYFRFFEERCTEQAFRIRIADFRKERQREGFTVGKGRALNLKAQKAASSVSKGYLFKDFLLNVASIPEEKHLTIRSMNHEAFLLDAARYSSKVGGLQNFLVLTLFVNMMDDVDFSTGEIASMVGMSEEAVKEVILEKVYSYPQCFRDEKCKEAEMRLSKKYPKEEEK